MNNIEEIVKELNDICLFVAGRLGLEQARCFLQTIDKTVALLKKQEEEIENLKQTAQSMMEGVCLLKEQEAVEPIYVGDDSYECGFCGTVIGWDKLNCSGIDSVRHNFCPNCGKKVKWDG